MSVTHCGGSTGTGTGVLLDAAYAARGISGGRTGNGITTAGLPPDVVLLCVRAVASNVSNSTLAAACKCNAGAAVAFAPRCGGGDRPHCPALSALPPVRPSNALFSDCPADAEGFAASGNTAPLHR